MISSSKKLLALVLALTPILSSASFLPEEVGVSLYTYHEHYNKGPYAWNNKTHGIYGIWPIAKLESVDVDLKAVASVLRLSTDKTGGTLGLMIEKDWFFASLSAASGYEKVIYSGYQYSNSTLECRNYCLWRTAKDQIVPVISIGAKINLPDNWKLRISYQPKPPGNEITPMWNKYRDLRRDASLTFWLGRTF